VRGAAIGVPELDGHVQAIFKYDEGPAFVRGYTVRSSRISGLPPAQLFRPQADIAQGGGKAAERSGLTLKRGRIK
jgi:hypothetical protein